MCNMDSNYFVFCKNQHVLKQIAKSDSDYVPPVVFPISKQQFLAGKWDIVIHSVTHYVQVVM